MNLRRAPLLLLAGALAASAVAQAKPRVQSQFVERYPAVANSKLEACGACHLEASKKLNPYGVALRDSALRFSAVEGLDSDGDGVVNAIEIALHTLPGEAADVPDSLAADSTAKALGTLGKSSPNEGAAAPGSKSRTKTKSKKSKKKEHDHHH